jgi:hypothetical protein
MLPNKEPVMPALQKSHPTLSAALLIPLLWMMAATAGMAQVTIHWDQMELQPGIVWAQTVDSLFGAPQFINLLVLDADTAAARFRLEAADRVHKANPSAEPVRLLTASGFARYFDPLAVINAGFFSDHPEYVNSGIFKVRGEVYPFMKKEPEELRFVGSSAIGLDVQGKWLFYNRVDEAWPSDWPEAYSAVAGAHRLLEDGHIPEPVSGENYTGYRERRHAGLRHPRTAICLTNGTPGSSGYGTTDLNHVPVDYPNLPHVHDPHRDSGSMDADSPVSDRPEIIILVADGRHDEAMGLTLRELASILHGLGCLNAVNLDGGGSSTLYLRSRGVVNHPSGNWVFDHEGERAVRTVIMIE